MYRSYKHMSHLLYATCSKQLFTAVHYFVHLNLALSLLLGYIVFMFGIELGTSSTVSEAELIAHTQINMSTGFFHGFRVVVHLWQLYFSICFYLPSAG